MEENRRAAVRRAEEEEERRHQLRLQNLAALKEQINAHEAAKVKTLEEDFEVFRSYGRLKIKEFKVRVWIISAF